MPEPILITRPAELVEVNEFQALSTRVTNIEAAQASMQHVITGFLGNDNVWVDGVLQNIADLRKQQAVLIKWVIRIGLPAACVGSLSVFSNSLHNYGLDVALGSFVRAALHLP